MRFQVLASVVLLVLAQRAPGKVIEVPGDQDDAQSAIEVADEGDVVVLKGGVHGPLLIEGKQSLVVRGEAGARVAYDGGTALHVLESYDVTLQDLAFGDANLVALLIDDSPAVTVRDCRFDLPGTSMLDGVYARDSDGLAVVGCRFTRFAEFGIHVEAGVGTRIEDCVVVGGQYGVTIGSTGGVVRRCTIRDQVVLGVIVFGTNNLLAASKVRGHVSLEGDAHVVRENRITKGGIWVEGTGHRVFGNRLKGGAVPTTPYASIRLADAVACVVAGNRIAGSAGIGVHVDADSKDDVLLENRVTNAASVGFGLLGSGNVLARNVAKGCDAPVADPTGGNVYAGNGFEAP